jgi:hypothetical protein
VFHRVVLDRAFEDRKLEHARTNAQDVHDGPIGVTRRSIGFLLALELSDHEQEIARFDVADPFASEQGVDVVLEPTEVSIGVADAIGKLCFQPSLGHGSKCHARAGRGTDRVARILQSLRLVKLSKRWGFAGSQSPKATVRSLHPVRGAVRVETGRPTLFAFTAHDPRSSSQCNTSCSRNRSLRPARMCGQP